MFTNERNIQILIGLLIKYNIRQIIVSPGTGVVSFVRSIQNHSFFTLYSVVDERSAAYMACGMAQELGEPVVIVCTGATASRNYIPALTEAFYRKIPILAITATKGECYTGHQLPQVIDRSQIQKDIAKISVSIDSINSEDDEWFCTIQINKALTALRYEDSGPVHINLTSKYSSDFSIKELPYVHYIKTINSAEQLPEMPRGNIGIFVGSHKKWTPELRDYVAKFCLKFNAVVYCDHTSNYYGVNKLLSSIILTQKLIPQEENYPDILIHIGETSGDYSFHPRKKISVWRISPNGEFTDTFHSLDIVFKMSEEEFFSRYTREKSNSQCISTEWIQTLKEHQKRIWDKIKNVPFSNIWIAQNTSKYIPEHSVIYLGILNSLRAWNFFEVKKNIEIYANTGGFGIDGTVSSAVGTALVATDKIIYVILGDLAFFYDLNIYGNRHFPNNIRIIVINNEIGCEFKLKINSAFSFGKHANDYIAAGGHYTSRNKDLIHDCAISFGFDYIRCNNKDEYLGILPKLTNPQIQKQPMLVECKTKAEDDVEAFEYIRFLEDPSYSRKIKDSIKNSIGEQGTTLLKSIMHIK